MRVPQRARGGPDAPLEAAEAAVVLLPSRLPAQAPSAAKHSAPLARVSTAGGCLADPRREEALSVSEELKAEVRVPETFEAFYERDYRRRSGRVEGPTCVRSHTLSGLESRKNSTTRSLARRVPSHAAAGHSRHVMRPLYRRSSMRG